MLLTLPVELVRLILRSCDPPTYLQTAFCNRFLFGIASQSRDLVLHQLHQSPGRNDDVESLTTDELFRNLMFRAGRELFGIEHDGDRTLFNFQGQVIDGRASTLGTVGTRGQALLAFQGHGTVYLLTVGDQGLSLECRIESPAKRFGAVQVLHTAFGAHGIYVLHRVKPFIDRDLDTEHPFVKRALESNAHGNMFLSYHALGSTTQTIRLYAFPNHQDYEPLALAVHEGKFAISWQHLNHSHDHQVVHYDVSYGNYDREGEDDKLESRGMGGPQVICSPYDSYVLTEVNDEGPSDATLEGKGPTVKLAFNDRGYQMLHYYKAHTLYSSFQRIRFLPGMGEYPGVRDNACNVQFSDSLTLNFSIGIPFFGTHQPDAETQGLRCRWKYLAIGIATHRVEHWTIVCLLKSEAACMATTCGHVLNLDRGRRYDSWKIMAQLGGFQESSTSHGSLIAASARGTRIAIASWKTVHIWSLEPNVVIEGEDDFYPESWQSPYGFPELKPATVQLEAVCHQLQFTDKEDELVAITDRGLLVMSLRLNGKGVRVVHTQSDWIVDEEIGQTVAR
ncbi:hypothetical protein N7523_010532 [Penicillium sp. IBT 18751x]|nr:hypothetical protein N7523_010532 [Penicillium sp. IBT 18751x]